MAVTLRLETHIAAPIERCWDLSLSVDAHTQSMAGSRERAVAGVTNGMLGAGECVTWEARHIGVPLRLTSRVTEYEFPARFVDEQIRGPFARWWHEHTFVSEGAAARMVDTIEFAAPLGVLGRVAERIVLERYMARLIARRNAWLKATLEAGVG